MKRVLLCALLLAAALALGMLLIVRHETPTLAVEPPKDLPALPEPERIAVKLSYVELAASPHRTEQPGATQVYGWLTRADDGRPVSGGTIRLRFQNFVTAPGSAAEEHADALARSRNPTGSYRDIKVQEDGGWYADLPGKCWILDAEYMPPKVGRGTLPNEVPVDEQGRPLSAFVVRGAFHKEPAPRQSLIRTHVSIEAPLERGALELSFAADPGLQVRGLVVDAQAGEPIADAHVTLTSLRESPVGTTTDEHGRFEILGIDPAELVPERGCLSIHVMAPDLRHAQRLVAWEPGQSAIPAFKVVLEPKSP